MFLATEEASFLCGEEEERRFENRKVRIENWKIKGSLRVGTCASQTADETWSSCS